MSRAPDWIFGTTLVLSMLAAMLASLGFSFLILKWLGQSSLPEVVVAIGQMLSIAAGIALAAISAKTIIQGFQRAYNR